MGLLAAGLVGCGGGGQQGGETLGNHDGGDSGAAGNGAAGMTGGDAGNLDGSIYFVTDAKSERGDGEVTDRDAASEPAPEAGPDGPTDLAKESAPDVAADLPADVAKESAPDGPVDAHGDVAADAPPTALDGSGTAGDALVACTWVGDFDGDGVSDCATLVQATGVAGDVVFRKGTGPATYSTTMVTSAGIVPSTTFRWTLAIVDLNHDGRQDVITVGSVWPDLTVTKYDQYVLMLSGQPDGTFVPRPGGDGIKTMGPSVGDLSLSGVLGPEFWADFDGDGFIDLPARIGFPHSMNEWVLLHSAGGADFKVTETPDAFTEILSHLFLVGHAIVSLGYADPGKLVCPFAYRTGVFITSGAPDGSMGSTRIADSDFASKVVAKDVDGDGLPDYVTTFAAGAPICGTRSRCPTVAFMSKLNYRWPPQSSRAADALDNMLDTGDFDTDGNADDVTLGCAEGDVQVYIHPHLGDSGLGVTVTLPDTAGALQYHVTQANADGKADIELTFLDGKKIFYGDGAGHFSLTPP